MHSGFRSRNFQNQDIQDEIKIYKRQEMRTQISNFYCLLKCCRLTKTKGEKDHKD